MMKNDRTRQRCLRELQSYSFAVYEALLYLDAYPDSKAALDFYNKYKKLEARARAEYEQKYGPITMPEGATSWQGTEGPWPWQNDEGRK